MPATLLREDLLAKLLTIGPIDTITYNPIKESNLYYAFVTFCNNNSAKKALKDLKEFSPKPKLQKIQIKCEKFHQSIYKQTKETYKTFCVKSKKSRKYLKKKKTILKHLSLKSQPYQQLTENVSENKIIKTDKTTGVLVTDL